MSQEALNLQDDPVAVLPQLSRRLDDIRASRNALDEDVMRAELSLNDFIASMDGVGQRLRRMRAVPARPAPFYQPPPPPVIVSPAAVASPAGMTLDEFKTHMGTLLQGSLDAVSDKLSGKIQGMLRDVRGLSGVARDVKMQEIKEAAEYEMVDFSSMYAHEKLQSNLGEVGVEEKESKGIDANLERLRKLRGIKTKPGEK